MRISGKRMRFFKVASVAACLWVLFAYFTHLPFTVQTGDTGELVANAYRLQVSHPSGYPLFIWLEFLGTHLLSFGSVFHRAAILNAVFSLGTLTLLVVSASDFLWGVGLALCFGFSGLFWKYTELPDVYALNNFLTAAFLATYFLNKDRPRLRLWGTTLLFFLGLTNHLSFIFLLPLVLHSWISSKRLKEIGAATLAGLLILGSAYFSLSWMHPESPYSWGEIKGTRGAIAHFLREDYGRTGHAVAENPQPLPEKQVQIPSQPSVKPQQPKPGKQFARELKAGLNFVADGPRSELFHRYLLEFGRDSLPDLFPVFLLLAAALALPRRNRVKFAWLLVGVATAYCYTIFSLVKIEPNPIGLLTTERFFIFPQLLLCFAAARLRWNSRALEIAFLFVFLISAGLNFSRNSAALDYSRNTIVEDYALNLLRMAPKDRPSIILAETDTEYFSLRYAQQIYGQGERSLVIAPHLLFHPWYLRKLEMQAPAFLPPKAHSITALSLNLESDLIDPNLGEFDFILPESFADPSRYRITQMALGRRVQKGHGLFFDVGSLEKLDFRSGPETVQAPLSEYDESRDLFSKYAYFYLARGLDSYHRSDLGSAYLDFREAVDKVPYCLPAISNLCGIFDSVAHDAGDTREKKRCHELKTDYQARTFDYFEEYNPSGIMKVWAK